MQTMTMHSILHNNAKPILEKRQVTILEAEFICVIQTELKKKPPERQYTNYIVNNRSMYNYASDVYYCDITYIRMTQYSLITHESYI